MAYFSRRPSGRVEIRQSIRSESGPRSRMLASFRGALDDRALDRAEARATRPIDRAALRARARDMGIEVATSSNADARALIGELQRGRALATPLARLLREALPEPAADRGADDALQEAAEWLGRGEAERGEALRGLLRLSDAIVRGRPARRAPRTPPYPALFEARASSDAGAEG